MAALSVAASAAYNGSTPSNKDAAALDARHAPKLLISLILIGSSTQSRARRIWRNAASCIHAVGCRSGRFCAVLALRDTGLRYHQQSRSPCGLKHEARLVGHRGTADRCSRCGCLVRPRYLYHRADRYRVRREANLFVSLRRQSRTAVLFGRLRGRRCKAARRKTSSQQRYRLSARRVVFRHGGIRRRLWVPPCQLRYAQ